MEKLVIVGNGSSMLDNEYGEQIDKFDLVCRMNRGFFEGIDGYEKNVGSRTDILIVHDGFMTDEYMSDELFENTAYILIGTPAFKWESEVQRIKNQYDKYPEKLVFIPTSVEANLKREAEFGGGWPSTGLIGTYHILKCFDMDVTLVGFDGYNDKYKFGHYFSKTDDRTTEYFYDKFKDGHHKISAERQCWEFLRDNFKPTILK
tara:strand:+ start:915 stop:1526 length:612 start_codon:yes stop_codon:yes gene_type:complete